VGAAGVQVPTHVHLLGSGPGVTMIRSSSSGAVVALSSSSSVHELTVKVLGGASQTIGIATATATDVVISDVTVEASGSGIVSGITCIESDARIEHADVTAGGGSTSFGISSTDTTLRLLDSLVRVAEGPGAKVGVFQGNGSLTLQRTSVTVDGSATTTAGARVYGVELGSASYASLTELTANVFGAPTQSDVGVSADASASSRSFEIHRSTILGEDYSVRAATNVTIRVAESQLKGGPVSNGSGSVTCFAVYDETFASAGLNTCP
jgi:hypothetical protein